MFSLARLLLVYDNMSVYLFYLVMLEKIGCFSRKLSYTIVDYSTTALSISCQ